MLFRFALFAIPGLLLIGCAQPGSKSVGGPMAEDEAEDREGRQAWELARLMDPATGEIPADIRRLEVAFAKTLPARAGTKSLSWSFRGPRNRGGRTRAFAVIRTNAQRLFAGGVSGGMWLSEDGGATWEKTTAPAALHSTTCIAQDPRTDRDSIWYYGSGENYGIVSGTSFTARLSGDGIFKSTDSGQSWTLLPSTIGGDPQYFVRNYSFKQVNSIAVDPVRNDSDVVLAAVYNGIFRSNDGGASWRPVLGLDTNTINVSTYTDIRVTTDGVYYAAIGNGSPTEGLWRSPDGIAWTEITPTGWPGAAEHIVLAVDPANDTIVWFFAHAPGVGATEHALWKYAYLSGDGSGMGGVWSSRTANLPDADCTGYFTFNFGPISTQSGYDMSIAVHPDSSDIVYIAGTNVYRSTNGWSTPNSYKWIGGYRCNTVDPKDYVWPGHHPDQHGLTFDPFDHTKLYSINDGGVHITHDPLADSVLWNELNTGYITSQFYTVHIEEGEATNDHLLGGLQDNGMYVSRTADPGDDWARVHQDDGAYGALPAGMPFILTSSQQGRLYKKTVDANFNITGFERMDPVGGSTTYNFINPFVLDPSDNNRLYWVSGNRLWRNNDLASVVITNNWYDKDTAGWQSLTTSAVPGTLKLSCVDISIARPTTAFYGTTTSGRLFRCDSLLNATPVRTEITGDSFPGGYVSCVAPNDLDPDEWVVTQSNYRIRSIWHTTDGGTTWTDVGGNLEEFPDGTGNGPAVFWALIYPTWGGTDDRYFVGTSTGLYSTDLLDGANTVWEQEGANSIGNVPVNMIASRNSDGLIAIATHGNGVYASHLPAAPIGVQEPAARDELWLWPNPAHDLVNVELPASSAAFALEVADASGRLVLRRSIPAHTTQWTWDLRDAQGSRVGKGTYVIAVQAGDRRRSMRVVVQ